MVWASDQTVKNSESRVRNCLAGLSQSMSFSSVNEAPRLRWTWVKKSDRGVGELTVLRAWRANRTQITRTRLPDQDDRIPTRACRRGAPFVLDRLCPMILGAWVW